jgi:ATP-binding cassette subfamily F protein uup
MAGTSTLGLKHFQMPSLLRHSNPRQGHFPVVKNVASPCAVPLRHNPIFFFLTNPTNHLDSESIRWLEDFLKTYTGAVIFVTHDRYFLNVIATRIIEISDGKAYSHPGNYTAFLESKAARQEIAENTEKKRQKFLKDELKWVKAGVKARTTKSRSRLDAFYEVKDQDAPVREGEIDLLIPPPPRLGNTIVDLEEVSITLGDRTLFRSMNLSLEEGQCTGIVGKNGVGKSTLLKICLQQLEPTSGKAILGKQVKINYIDQSRMQLDGTGSLLDEISDGNEKIEFGDEILGARAYLRRFLFSDERINERVDLSQEVNAPASCSPRFSKPEVTSSFLTSPLTT